MPKPPEEQPVVRNAKEFEMTAPAQQPKPETLEAEKPAPAATAPEPPASPAPELRRPARPTVGQHVGRLWSLIDEANATADVLDEQGVVVEFSKKGGLPVVTGYGPRERG